MEQKRLVVQISKELHSKFKSETAITGLTMSDAIIALIEIFLSNKNIIEQYSENFIHRDMIKDEIYRRLKEQEEKLTIEHEKKIEILRNQYELEYQIKEDGYIAEIMRKKQIKK